MECLEELTKDAKEIEEIEEIEERKNIIDNLHKEGYKFKVMTRKNGLKKIPYVQEILDKGKDYKIVPGELISGTPLLEFLYVKK